MEAERKATFKAMLVPIAIALAFAMWGLMVFVTVGDKDVEDWDFGTIPDVPGQSPYSVERKGREVEEELPRKLRESIPPQHVDGPPGRAPEEVPDRTRGIPPDFR